MTIRRMPASVPELESQVLTGHQQAAKEAMGGQQGVWDLLGTLEEGPTKSLTLDHCSAMEICWGSLK